MQIPFAEFSIAVSDLERKLSQITIEQRSSELSNIDPYPQIPPALLNAGYLASYALSTGMIEPFDIGALTKPATYLVPLRGPVRYQDDSGNVQSFFLSSEPVSNELDVRSSFSLRPNSLCYVTLQPRFRMPPYIAGRFNLLIRDVYRGLLVGTGPLVDPGFSGYLSIPVHNFTSNEYILRADEGFVYFEFTKLSFINPENSAIPIWVPKPVEDQPPFPSSKNQRRSLDDYIIQATGGRPAQNSIHYQFQRIESVARRAESNIRLINIGAIVGGIVFVLTVLGLLISGIQLYLGVQQFSQSVQSQVQGAIVDHDHRILELEQRVQRRKTVVVNPR